MIAALSRPLFGLRLLSLAVLLCLPLVPGAAEERPNIILLFIDDLGIGDISAFAAEDLETPNIDRLAVSGVRFTNGYVPFSICSPSRASVMTGVHAARFGHFGNSFRGTPLPEGHPTMANALREAGYVTGMIGRMDMGSAEQTVFGIGVDEVAKRRRPPPREERTAKPRWSSSVTGATYLGEDGSYWTEVNQQDFNQFIDRHQERPFYLYYAPLAVHFPVEEVPEKYLVRVPASVEPDRRYFAGTLIALDDTIGVLLDRLEAEGLFENTLIFFMGDNGGWPRDGSRNGPLRGGKVTPWDGGFRVPYMVSWPAMFEGGGTLDGLVSSLDVYPTAMAAAGLPEPPGLDGVNLLPFLRGDRDGSPHGALFFRWLDTRTAYHDARIVRSGPWRLVVYRNPWDLYRGSPTGYRTVLHHLEDDPGERKDLSLDFPDRVIELKNRYREWEKTLPEVDYSHEYAPGIPMPYGKGWAYADRPETH